MFRMTQCDEWQTTNNKQQTTRGKDPGQKPSGMTLCDKKTISENSTKHTQNAKYKKPCQAPFWGRFSSGKILSAFVFFFLVYNIVRRFFNKEN